MRALLSWPAAANPEPMSEDEDTEEEATRSPTPEATQPPSPTAPDVRRSGRKRKQSLASIEAGSQKRKSVSDMPSNMLTKAKLQASNQPPQSTQAQVDDDPFKRTGIPRTPTNGCHASVATTTTTTSTIEDPITTETLVATSAPTSTPAPSTMEILTQMQLMMTRMESNMQSTFRREVKVAAEKTSQELRDMKTDLATRISATEEVVATVTEKQGKTEKLVEKLQEDLLRERSELPSLVEKIIAEKLQAGPSGNSDLRTRRPRQLGQTAPMVDREAITFNKARRSIHLYPITETNPRRSVEEFLVDHLGMDRDEVAGLEMDIKPLPSRPAPAVQKEANITFETVEERDRVRRLAKNLAGKPQGMRIDVPFHLRKQHRMLQALAFDMKKKTPALKRNIRLNDDTQGLTMDFSTNGQDWRTVQPEEAATAMTRRTPRSDSITAVELEDLLVPVEEEAGQE